MRAGARRRTISLALALAALLAMGGAKASADPTVSPTSFDFGDQTVGSGSETKLFIVTAYCNVPHPDEFECLDGDELTMSIGTTGPFVVRSHDCPSVLKNNVTFPNSCTIRVGFQPTAVGPATGTLFTGAGGPTAELRGLGAGALAPPSQPPLFPPPAPPPASNRFTFGGVSLDRTKGTATLVVEVPGPGRLALSGGGIVAPRPAAGSVVKAAGEVKLRIKPKGKAKEKLAEAGKVTVQAKVTFTPTGGSPASKTKPVHLRKQP